MIKLINLYERRDCSPDLTELRHGDNAAILICRECASFHVFKVEGSRPISYSRKLCGACLNSDPLSWYYLLDLTDADVTAINTQSCWHINGDKEFVP